MVGSIRLRFGDGKSPADLHDSAFSAKADRRQLDMWPDSAVSVTSRLSKIGRSSRSSGSDRRDQLVDSNNSHSAMILTLSLTF